MRANGAARRAWSPLLLAALALSSSLFAVDLAAQVPTVYIDPSPAAVNPDEEFDLHVLIDQDADTFSNFQVVFRFDPAILELVHVYEGALYTGYSGQRWFAAEEESLGTWEVFDVIFPAMSYVVAPGELALLRFRALASGESPVAFLIVSLRDIYRDPILPVDWEDGLVRVGDLTGAAGPPEGAGSWWLGPPSPNPSAGGVALSFAIPPGRAATCRIAVYDAAGRLVRELLGGGVPAFGRLTWDGRDDGGREAPAGAYFVRFEAKDRILTRKLLRVR